jgi:D-amino-acid dehydrogenase
LAKHVAIIGGGVIGMCAAYACSQRGHRVTLIDRNPLARDGCSFGNAGMIVPSHFIPLAAPGMVALGLKWMWNSESPFYVKPRLSWDLLSWGWRFWRASSKQHVATSGPVLRDLHLASRACYERMADTLPGEIGLKREGLLMLCKTQHVLDEEAHTADLARQLGIPAEVLDAAGAAKLDPNVRMDIRGAVYFPRDCHLSPQRLMAALQAKLETDGCRILWNTEAIGFDLHGRRVHAVRTSREAIEADEFVVAGGSWSPALASMLRLNLPMQAGKGYSLTLAKPRQLPRICSIFTEARVAVTPMGETLRVGGTMEISGLSEAIDPARVRGIVKAVPQYYPDFQIEDFADIKPWVGLRPCSPDGLPYLGRTRRFDNVILSTGHAMMGLSLGPVSGEIVAQIATGEKPTIDLAKLDPDRY